MAFSFPCSRTINIANRIGQLSFEVSYGSNVCVQTVLPYSFLVFNSLTGIGFESSINSVEESMPNGTYVGYSFGSQMGKIRFTTNSTHLTTVRVSYISGYDSSYNFVLTNDPVFRYSFPTNCQNHSTNATNVYFAYLGPSFSKYTIDYTLDPGSSVSIYDNDGKVHDTIKPYLSVTKQVVESTLKFHVFSIDKSQWTASQKVAIKATGTVVPEIKFKGAFSFQETKWVSPNEFWGSFPNSDASDDDGFNFGTMGILLVFLFLSTGLFIFAQGGFKKAFRSSVWESSSGNAKRIKKRSDPKIKTSKDIQNAMLDDEPQDTNGNPSQTTNLA